MTQEEMVAILKALIEQRNTFAQEASRELRRMAHRNIGNGLHLAMIALKRAWKE